MKRINGLFALMLAAVCFVMSGCTVKNVEAQAYAVSLGIDMTEEGGIGAAVQVPSLSSGGSSESGGGGDSAYSFSEAKGDTLTGALEMLNAGLPRELNLTGVKCIVVSEELARSEKFSEVLEEMSQAYRVYGAAEVIVCRGQAAEFIRGQKPVIGMRLSESTAVEMQHYRDLGCIPSARAADVYYMSRSVYGDPVAVYAAAGSSAENTGNEEELIAGELPEQGDRENQYYGTALMDGGRMTGILSGEETQLLNVLLGEIEYFSWVVEGVPVRINVSSGPEVRTDLRGSVPVIEVGLRFNMMTSKEGLEEEELKKEIERRLNEMTRQCQAAGADPFRYAEWAARSFLTVEDWVRYGWKERFPEADIRYDVRVKRIEL